MLFAVTSCSMALETELYSQILIICKLTLVQILHFLLSSATISILYF